MRQVAVVLNVIDAVADNEFIGDFKTDPANGDIDFAA